MQAIETVTVGSGGQASITFSSIPDTFTDLYLVVSTQINNDNYFFLRPNGLTTDQSSRVIFGNGSSASSDSSSNIIVQSGFTTWGSDIFGNSSVYITNYASSQAKSFSIDSVTERNNTTSALRVAASVWNSSSAVSSLVLASSGNFVEHSTATLYGIKSTAGSGAPKATGGMISYDAANNKWVHVFTASGTFTPTEDLTCEYLVIAGGGSGGWGVHSGAGGAGGYRSSVVGESSGANSSAESTSSLTDGTGYAITVGAGGPANTSGSYSAGTVGSNSVFNSITADGGGRGGAYQNNSTGGNGGSGGGGAGDDSSPGGGGNGTSLQGLSGGAGRGGSPFTGGGGGGAGSSGIAGTSTGNGGNGLASSITGTSVTRAGGGGRGYTVQSGTQGIAGAGGGGNGGTSAVVGFSGLVGTGGGGGGGGQNPSYGNSGAGGSGIVIIRYGA